MPFTESNPGPWLRGMEALHEERDLAAIERIEGTLPADLRGTLYRIGPGKHDVGGHRFDHWFDGDGMIVAYRFDGERVTFRNRYVRTPWYDDEQRAGRPLYPNFGTRGPGGYFRRAMRHGAPKNPANTNIVRVEDRLLALWEGGRPFQIDPDTLATIGESDLHGALPRGASFSAHPHLDAATGELFNIGLVMGGRPSLHVWKMEPGLCAKTVARIRLKRPFLIHDFAVSAGHIVILAGPLYMSMARLAGSLVGLYSMADCFSWHAEESMRIYVVDRHSGAVRECETDCGMVVHIANAFEADGDVVVDAVLYTGGNPFDSVSDGFRGITPRTPPGILTRFRIGANGQTRSECLGDTPTDFPRINESRSAHPHRYVYGAEFAAGLFGSSRILKTDTHAQRTESHDFGEGCFVGEPVFVPRPGGSAEDDGWLVTVVYDSRDHHSFVGIVDARSMGSDLARVHLPFHTPLGFHGNFCATP